MKKIFLTLFTFFLVLFQSGCSQKEPVYLEPAAIEHTDNSEMEDTEEHEPTEQVSGGFCYVYVCGAVNCPGVYTLPEGSRVFEAITLAGGLCEDAGVASVNQAEPVTDGQMLYIPTQEEAEQEQAAAIKEEKEAADSRVNINTASLAELMTLPGVGESKAKAIIAYREEKGAFSAIDEIKNVEGIKDGVYNRIKEQIRTE